MWVVYFFLNLGYILIDAVMDKKSNVPVCVGDELLIALKVSRKKAFFFVWLL